jgi:hypothetical protein
MQTRILVISLLVVSALGVGAMTQARLDRVSGTLTRTYTIVADTELTGDVTCAVADGTPCFSFTVPGVGLRLNGFTVTGKGDPVTGCGGTPTNGEIGISTNNQSQVTVSGPGLVQRFRGHGVQVVGSSNARVEGITVSTNCGSGIFATATAFDTLVQGNTALRNGSTVAGASCGGI